MDPALVSWLLAAMTTWSPAPLGEEARFTAIATDILTVATDPAEAPLFDGDGARERTALLLAAFAWAESGGFRADVDLGKRRGHGGAVCLLQIKVDGRTDEGWTAKELLADRTRCVRAALHRMQASMDKCQALRDADRLGLYTHGRCVPNNAPARYRYWLMSKWWKAHPTKAAPKLAPPAPPP